MFVSAHKGIFSNHTVVKSVQMSDIINLMAGWHYLNNQCFCEAVVTFLVFTRPYQMQYNMPVYYKYFYFVVIFVRNLFNIMYTLIAVGSK